MQHIFIYGPPGSGKTTLGRALAGSLGLEFCDLDSRIVKEAGKSIPEIFAAEGEAGFRRHEAEQLRQVAGATQEMVVALGGGALLDPVCRKMAEGRGQVLVLEASLAVLQKRTAAQAGTRPLLTDADEQAAENRLAQLLEERREHYASFELRLDASQDDLAAKLALAQRTLGVFRISGMGPQTTAVRIGNGLIGRLGEYVQSFGWQGSFLVIADANTADSYGRQALESLQAAGYRVTLKTIPAGESHKSLETVASLWSACVEAGIDRGGTIVAVGGGVVGDLSGFVAATWMRGVRWVGIPTTLLAMVDSSLGGKTAFDLPEGKNLVGAFHPPALVLADPTTLVTLPEEELRSGAAEAVKHGVISDPALFAEFEGGGEWGADAWTVARVARAMAVKLAIIEEDPYEKGVRAALNLGHTIGHAIELASGFGLRHGEAVAVGMVAEARLAERMGLAEEEGLSGRLVKALTALKLPVELPGGLDRKQVGEAMLLDKKTEAGRLRFALPLRIGEVRTRVEASLEEALGVF